MEGDQDENAPANICSLRTFYTKFPIFFDFRVDSKQRQKPLFAETSESWLDWSAILASVDWCACAKPSKPTCKKRICCRLALKNNFTQTHVAFRNETDLLQAVRWGLRKSCLKMSQVRERHRHLAIEANLRAHRTDAKQSLTSKGWFRGNSTIHEGFFKHFKSLRVSVDPKHSEVHWAHGANYTCLPPQMLHLTLPLCPLVFINICFLLQAHSICLCILLSFEIQKTQTLWPCHSSTENA